MEVTDAHEARAVTDITQADPSFVPGAAGGRTLIRHRAVYLVALEWTEREAPDAVAGEPLRHLCSRHILWGSQAEADEVLARLDVGEEFGLLAIDLSLDPGSGSLGGDLGCVLEGSFVPLSRRPPTPPTPARRWWPNRSSGFHVIEVLSSGLATEQNHPQLDAEALAYMAEDAELAAGEIAQSDVQAQRQQLLFDLQESVFEHYGHEVLIDDRYGRWDPDEFRVVLEQTG